jgi:hypothetical protein
MATVLSEHVFYFAEKRTDQGLIINFCGGFQFLQQFFLALAELAGNLHAHFDIEIAFAVTVEDRHTFVADAKGGAGLGTIGNLEQVLAFESGDANLRAHSGLGDGERHGAVQIITFADEEGMLLHVQDNVEIAGGSAEGSSLAAAGKANARAIFHACGDFGVDRALMKKTAFAFALGAGIGNHAAGSLTCGASAGDAEKALLIAHLAAALAGAATGGTFAGGGSGAVAGIASLMTANVDASFDAEYGFFKLQSDIFAEVSAALHTAAAAASGSEGVSEAEELAEDFAEVLEGRAIKTSARRGRAADSRVAKAIVERALLGVAKNGVGFGDFLEFFFRIRIIRVAIGMPLHGELAIRALELNFGDGAADAKHFVVIAFCVRGQNWRLSFICIPSCEYTDVKFNADGNYFPGFLATFTIAGRSKRSLSL